jgi:hypothetical protein
VILIIKYRPKINVIVEGIFKLSVEMRGIGIVSAKYKEINELFTGRRVLNFSIIFQKIFNLAI